MSDRIGLPVAIGVLKPMIVLPETFVATEPDDCLEAALAHESAHIRNGDLRWLTLLRLLNVVFYAQPLFWWLRRKIRADQEVLADAAASTLHGDGRLAYAETLIGWARSLHRPHQRRLCVRCTGALGAAVDSCTGECVLLLDHNYRVEHTTSRRWKLVAGSLGALTAFLLSMVTLRPSAVTAQEMMAKDRVKNHANNVLPTATPTSDRFEYAGRVLDSDDKPVAGARIISRTLDIMARPRRQSAPRATL